MRKINWDSALTAVDKEWLRNTGMLGIEDRISANESQFSVVDVSDEELLDDYSEWKTAELAAEVDKRNDLPDTTSVEVVGTGANGNALKPDYIAALRQWDRENPEN